MISFYPGPSKTDDRLPEYFREAHVSGILSANHRSPEFMKLYRSLEKIFRKRLHVPENYQLIFTSSATECWEIIAQSLTPVGSYHFYNGAFGEKWFNYARKLRPAGIGYRFSIDVELTGENLDLTGDRSVICITQNETSNGTQVSNKRIGQVREKYPEHLIAIDATSSMGGVNLDFNLADIWFASVQKCFGLPAGMGLLLLSPAAIARARDLSDDKHYNSLPFVLDNANKHQTAYTPNVLAIFFLYKVLKSRKKIEKIQEKLEKRLNQVTKIIGKSDKFNFLCEDAKIRSTTVLTVKALPEDIAFIKTRAKENNIELGKGYGTLREKTFRIANFPAINQSEWKKLKAFLKKHT